MGFAQTRANGLRRWLAGKVGKAYAYSLGLSDDRQHENIKAAAKWKWPLPGVGSTDTLDLLAIGEHRGILKGPSEEATHYQERLSRAHEMWYWTGTRAGAVQPFEAYEGLHVTGAQLVYSHPSFDGREAGDLFYRHEPPSSDLVRMADYSGGHPGWPLGSCTVPWWSKTMWWVDCTGEDAPWKSDGTHADEGTFADEGLVGSTAKEEDLRFLRRVILQTKSEHSYPIYIAVVFSGDSIHGYLPTGKETVADDDGTFGDTGEVVFWRIQHFNGEGLLYHGTPVGTFAEGGTHDTNIIDPEFI